MRSLLNHRVKTVLATYFSWYSNIREEVYSSVVHTKIILEMIFLQELLKNSLNCWILLVCTENGLFFVVFWAFLTKKYLEALIFWYFDIYMTIKSDLFEKQSIFLLILCIFTGLSRNSNRARHLGMCSLLNHRAETVLVTIFSWYSNIRED